MNLEDELEGGEEDVESVDDQVYPNLFDDMFYFEQCGVGLPRLATVRLNLSVRKLIARTKIVNVRYVIYQMHLKLATLKLLNYFILFFYQILGKNFGKKEELLRAGG